MYEVLSHGGGEVNNMIKKFLVGSFAGTLILAAFAVSVFAKVDRVPGPAEYGPWMLNADSSIVFTCGVGQYSHTLDTVINNPDGSFTGTGSYDNGPHTWNISGNVNGDSLTFTIVYTGANAGYTLNSLDGVIDPDGSISGTVNNNCQTYITEEGFASREESQFTGNHGQWVSSQENKQEAAQSRIGMPVQSKGHTK